MRTHVVVFVVALLAMAAAAGAWAAEKDAAYYQKQFERWSAVIADLKGADMTGVAGQDIEVIRTWIGQAQAFLASDKLSDIEPLLLRIEAQVEYVRTRIDRAAADAAAKLAEEAAATAEKGAQEATAAAEAAEAKVKELESKGL